MSFWLLEAPTSSSDYANTHVNGSLAHPYSLPGVNCNACHATWGGSRVLPVSLPASLRGRPEFTNPWPIDSDAHAALRRVVAEELEKAGDGQVTLEPGDSFQPGTLDIPSFPTVDFLWPQVGAPVVGNRIRDGFRENQVTGVELVPVVPGRIGKRSSKSRPRVPRTGEPEDMITELKTGELAAAVPELWEVVVTAESKLHPSVKTLSACSACGLQTFSDPPELRMTSEMWPGTDLFYYSNSLWLIASQRVKDLLTALHASNIAMVELP